MSQFTIKGLPPYEILLTRSKISRKISELAIKTHQKYKNKIPVVIVVLKGAAPFAHQIMDKWNRLGQAYSPEYMKITSYDGTETTGKPVVVLDVSDSAISGKDVLVIEDIVDTGITLNILLNHLKKKGAGTVRVLALLSKPERRKIKVDIDFCGFKIPNKYVVGFGLDMDDRFRWLPNIIALKG
jgi:hypoxanthine phosphoribosyltransferase